MRLALLCTLTAGVGHELRNLVMPLMLRLDVLTARSELSDDVLDDVNRIRRCVTQLRELADSLHLIIPDPLERPSDVHETHVRELADRIRTLAPSVLPQHVVLDIDVAEDIPAVLIPPAVIAESLLCILTQIPSKTPLTTNAAALLPVTIAMRASVDGVLVEISYPGADGADESPTPAMPQAATAVLSLATEDDIAIRMARTLLMPHGGIVLAELRNDHTRVISLLLPFASVSYASTSRRVRVHLTEPRRLAVVRHMLQASGWHEVLPDVVQPIDLIICDMHQLDVVAQDVNGPDGNSSSTRILVVAPRPSGYTTSRVEFVDAADAEQLSKALRRVT